MRSTPPLRRCPVCDAPLGGGPRALLANQGFLLCSSCSHQVRRSVENEAPEPGLRVTTGAREPTVSRCDRRMRAIQNLGVHGGHLLELGCGAGRFLLVARARGFEVAAVESDEARRHAARGATGLAIAAHTGELPVGASYQAVACWGGIARLAQPLALLRWCAGAMRPGALLALSCPADPGNEEGTLHRFTSASLSLCALRAGFEVLQAADARAGAVGFELYARLR
jgi:2-polyprenyl-3-methyl-5-hydroxy-6-metoxy-1,4-benzoquinol methylase